MHCMPSDALVPILLRVIVASIVDATGFQEETSAACFFGKSVSANDA